MPKAVALMRAIMGGATTTEDARHALDRCLSAEVEPLHWCAIHLGLAEAEIMRRAAAWAGLQFMATVPGAASASVSPAKLEHLSKIRVFRVEGSDEELAVAAPDFFGVLRLERAIHAEPGLRTRVCLVPARSLRSTLVVAAREALIDGARQTLSRVWPYAAAQLDLVLPLRWLFAAGLSALALMLLLAPLWGQLWLLPIWMVLMLLPTALRLWALSVPSERAGRYRRLPEADLPPYTVLVPLRDEANMVDQLVAHLGAIDYPADRIEIVFVVESRSPETIAAVQRHLTDARMSLVVVPDAAPRTKPKALDFVLPLCRGDLVVVYDAEDRPDPQQLRLAAAQFRQSPRVECIQARLTIDNGDKGLVPALFAGEYAGLFAVMLPALARWGAVMPLGGTSNHFRLATLRQLGGWDAFNVTEDADLGVRLARRHLRTATTTSVTLEEAPTSLRLWMGQRTRWMKGWMQTYVVHNRRSRRLLSDLGLRGFILFQITILGMLLAPLLHIGMWPMLVWMQLSDASSVQYLSPWWLACLTVLVVGHGTAIAVNWVGLSRVGQSRYTLQQLALPLYWLLITWATLLALREFVRRPFHWFKSPHEATTTPSAKLGEAAAPAE